MSTKWVSRENSRTWQLIEGTAEEVDATIDEMRLTGRVITTMRPGTRETTLPQIEPPRPPRDFRTDEERNAAAAEQMAAMGASLPAYTTVFEDCPETRFVKTCEKLGINPRVLG